MAKEIALVLTVKLILIFIIKSLFFSNPQKVDEETIQHQLFSSATPLTPQATPADNLNMISAIPSMETPLIKDNDYDL